MRKDIQSLESCCSEDVFKIVPCRVFCPWYRCLSYCAGILFGSVLAIPWLFRIWFYYTHEHAAVDFKRSALIARHMSMPFTGSFVSFLSPGHPLFIFIYGLIIIEIIVLVILPRRFQAKLKFIVRQCFRDMKNTSKLDVCASFVSFAFLPCKKLGIVGVLAFVIWLLFFPLYLVLFAMRFFPVLNVSCRLLVNLIYYLLKTVHPSVFNVDFDFGFFSDFVRSLKSVLVTDLQERNSRSNKCVHALALALGLVTIWMLLILVWECVYFYIECAVYTMCGIILNASFLMRYITLLVIIVFYAYDCVNGVACRYVSFNKTLCAQIEKLIGDKAKAIAMCSADEQKNTAFKVSSRSGKEERRMKLICGSEQGFLKWQTARLLYFLDKKDVPYIPKNFFLTFSKSFRHFICPGPIHLLYLKALFDFCLIVIFLTFVFIVIIAFGKARNASDGSQSIATLASGFLPFVFRKFLFKSHSTPSFDSNNLKWQATFREEVEAFVEKWTISDIITSSPDDHEEPMKISDTGDKSVQPDRELCSPSHGLLSETVERNVEDIDILAVLDHDNNMKLYVPKCSERYKQPENDVVESVL